MSTRVVEKKLLWCHFQLVNILAESGYTLSGQDPKEGVINGKYTKPNKKGMLYRPMVMVKLLPISMGTTRISVSFPIPWKLVTVLSFGWFFLGLAPALMFAIASTKFGFEVLLHDRFWNIITKAACLAWALAFICWKAGMGAHKVEKHWRKIEQLVWDRLDPDKTASHEVVSPSKPQVDFLCAIKWLSLGVTLLGGLFLITSQVLPPVRWALEHGWGGDSVFWHLIVTSVLRPMGTALGLIFFGAGGCCFVISGWVLSSWMLPHRFHWKVGFGATYMLWAVVVFLPVVLVIVHTFTSIYMSAGLKLPPRLLQMPSTIAILFVQVVGIVTLLRIWPESRDIEAWDKFYEVPSTTYEEFSEQSLGSDIKHLLKRYRVWAWTAFLMFTALSYVAAVYLVLTIVENIAATFGAEWAMGHAWHWPVILPVEGRARAIQSLVLACLMGNPFGVSVVHLVRSRLHLKRRLEWSRDLYKRTEQFGLGGAPIDCLKRELKADVLRIALVPVSGVNLQVERASLFRREYLLWVTMGARRNLSREELKALFWHECGHASLFRRVWWRELAEITGHWGPRFLDLAEDLYEQERQADLYAVKKMKTADPLISALRKLEAQQKSSCKKKAHTSEERSHRWFSEDAMKMIWNLEWAGYLHPDVCQRIRWLEKWEKESRMTKPLLNTD